MFAPRFSIRTALIITTGFAFYFLLAGLGVRGHAWAGAIAIGTGSLAAVALVHALLFLLCWIMAGGVRRRADRTQLLPAAQDVSLMPDGTSGTPTEEARRDVT